MNLVKKEVKEGTFLSGATAEDIMVMPYIRTEKPIRILPAFLRPSLCENIWRTIPIRAKKGVKDVGLNMLINMLSELIAFRDSSQAVKVVPRLAPRMRLTPCDRVIIPALTNPTSMTVEAEEDCTTAVMRMPKK